MLKSTRPFGVEIEFFAPDKKTETRLRDRKEKIVHDGSLRDFGKIPYGLEYVSPPLVGESGVKEVYRVCQLLKEQKCHCEDPAASLHVHLDGYRGVGRLIKTTKRDETAARVVGVSNRAAKDVSEKLITALLRDEYLPRTVGLNYKRLDNVLYVSYGKVSRHPKMNYKYYEYREEDRFPWLRNVFYFYTQYSEVMTSMLSPSRREGNMYCIPLHCSFALEAIESCNTMEELYVLWYKGGPTHPRYDDSRYHAFNLDCYFNRYGTIEVRSHGGTIDPDKILLWVRLHQHIADKLEHMTLEEIKSTGDLYKDFLRFFDDDELLKSYIKRTLGFFSGIYLNKL